MTVLKSISRPVPYTASPILLALSDIWLFACITFTWPLTNGLPSIILPFYPYRSGPLDELYPSLQNIQALVLHAILVVVQLSFLLLLIPSLLVGIPVPLLGWTPTCILIVTGFVLANNGFCVLLNGTKRRYASISKPDWKQDEKWIFINGVAVGDHWMQSNLDRLALTFRRPIHGIHNKTRGIIFDVIECIIQRTFGYATTDVRDVFADVSEFITDEVAGVEAYSKIVVILHSQGAVEGGLVLDWLYASLNQDLLSRVEIYTFGSAANHFNSPVMRNGQRVVRHIEHFANLSDYVSRFGILHFRPLPRPGNSGVGTREAHEKVVNTYVGRLFVRKGSGHQLNGNYLDSFFTMKMNDQDELITVDEDNDFMSSELNEQIFDGYNIASKANEKDYWDGGKNNTCEANGNGHTATKIKDVCRLWQYRNGMSPDDGGRASTWPIEPKTKSL